MRISDWSSDVCSSDLLVDRYESQIAIHRHGFSRAEKPARLVRQDLFLARDERNLILALDRHYAVIDLQRQQPEGKADHAARMRAHALHRQIGLAGIGRAQNSG